MMSKRIVVGMGHIAAEMRVKRLLRILKAQREGQAA